MVYLIHLQTPLFHSWHYIGFAVSASSFVQRIKNHANGNGARFIRAANAAGIKWKVVRTFDDYTRDDERKLKRCKNAKFFCPICNPKSYLNRGKHGKQIC